MPTEKRNPRVVIYARVSQDRGSKSVPDQITECRSAAEREGWEVIAEIPDKGSASRHRRKERERWPEAAKLIESGKATMLMTWEFSRATRELGFYVALRDACGKAKCLWWYGGTVYDMSKREDRFRTGMDALLAEDEADRTSERVNRGMRSSAHRAVANQGRPAYGYRSVYDRGTGLLLGREPDPETAPIVREVAERILEGEALLSICRDLNGRGITTPKGTEWNQTKLRLMVSRPALAGLRVFQGQVHSQAQWDPILTAEQHHHLLNLFSDPRRRTSRDGSIKHLLTGIALCGACGSGMRQFNDKSRKTGKAKPKYRCRDCGLSRAQWLADEVVSQAVVKRLSRDDARQLFLPDRSEEVAKAREELATLKARLEECYRQAESDNEDERLSPLGLARMEKSLQPKIEEAEQKLRSIHLPPLVARMLEGPQRVWGELDVVQHRELVRALMTVTILPTDRGPFPDPESIRVDWLPQ